MIGKLRRFICMKLGLLLILAVLLAGCNTMPVAEGIDQGQANEIIALLHARGISAVSEKERGGRGHYAVSVRKQDYSQAVTLLSASGYPHKARQTFSELIAQRGVLPSSREEEALRLDYALGVEIAELLQNHPKIASARASLRLNYRKGEEKPGVAVVVQTLPGAELASQEVSDIVVRLVPGVSPEDIKISVGERGAAPIFSGSEGVYNVGGEVFRMPLVPFLIWRVPEQDYQGIMLWLLGVVVATGLAGYFVGHWYSTSKYVRRGESSGELPDSALVKALRLERSRKNLPEE